MRTHVRLLRKVTPMTEGKARKAMRTAGKGAGAVFKFQTQHQVNLSIYVCVNASLITLSSPSLHSIVISIA